MDTSYKFENLTEHEKELFIPNLDMCFDWIQVTFQECSLSDVVRNLFGLELARCNKTNSGKFGYNETYTVYSKCHIMRNTKNLSMGVHVLLSGSACREYEMCFDWQYFFKSCEMMKGKFTRIDVAIDCYKRYFTVNQLKNKIKKGELVSKFKKSTYVTEYNLSDGSSNSASLKFGSMSSDIYIVIYDKLAERMNAGYSVKSNIKFWTRCELRFKHDLSNSVSSLYLNHNFDLSKFIFKVLYNYLDFKDCGNNKQKTRWKTSQFWLEFLGDCEKEVISVKAFQSTIQTKKEYAESCLNKLMAMLYCCDNEWIRDLLKSGSKKLNDHDLSVINSFMIENNMKIITKNDVNNMFESFDQLQLFKPVG